MAKEFERYNRTYKHLERTDSMESLELQERAKKIIGWQRVVYTYPQERIRFAVYEAPGFESWQRFRVSLKGQSTGMKLLRLMHYANAALHNLQAQKDIERIRVDNYIGALKRGGQLDDKYRIVK
jgi:hypothetical protein